MGTELKNCNASGCGVVDYLEPQSGFWCLEHNDLPRLVAVGAHTLAHSRPDSLTGGKYKVIVLRPDNTLVLDEGEPIMLLRGRDPLSAPTARFYRGQRASLHRADPALVALDNLAMEMERWEPKRLPT
ncbi:MAG: hypothetical protein Q8R28_15475 [Dehalococcoidia bacterium]|nr:hypothetical protein [Dehalococcoidia bacterium]